MMHHFGRFYHNAIRERTIQVDMRADLFVYGTLRQSEQAHELLGPDAVLIRDAITLPNYTLYRIDWYPGLVEEGTTAVKGELWSIQSARWAYLDEYEDVPVDYVRKKITLVGGVSAYAYIYVGSLHEAVLLSSGDWLQK